MTRVSTPVEVWNKEKNDQGFYACRSVEQRKKLPGFRDQGFHICRSVEQRKKLPGFRDSAKLLHKAKFVSPFDTWKKIKNDEGSL